MRSRHGADRFLLIGGNDQRASAGGFASVGSALDTGVLRDGRSPAFAHVLIAGHPEGHPALGVGGGRSGLCEPSAMVLDAKVDPNAPPNPP